MGVFTFVLNKTGGEWTAKQHSGDIEASAESTFEIQRKLVQAALAVDSTGGVQSSYSPISPSSAVFQVPRWSSLWLLILIWDENLEICFCMRFQLFTIFHYVK